jgi:hypothetical protein
MYFFLDLVATPGADSLPGVALTLLVPPGGILAFFFFFDGLARWLLSVS